MGFWRLDRVCLSRGRVEVFDRRLSGADVTAAYGFDSAPRESDSVSQIVAFDDGMVPSLGAALDLKSPKSELVRLWNARTWSKINYISGAFDYAKQAGPEQGKPVTYTGATVEVERHADL